MATGDGLLTERGLKALAYEILTELFPTSGRDYTWEPVLSETGDNHTVILHVLSDFGWEWSKYCESAFAKILAGKEQLLREREEVLPKKHVRFSYGSITFRIVDERGDPRRTKTGVVAVPVL